MTTLIHVIGSMISLSQLCLLANQSASETTNSKFKVLLALMIIFSISNREIKSEVLKDKCFLNHPSIHPFILYLLSTLHHVMASVSPDQVHGGAGLHPPWTGHESITPLTHTPGDILEFWENPYRHEENLQTLQ